MQYRSCWMTEELDVFREQFRRYLTRELAPQAMRWRDQKIVDRSAWLGLGAMGALLPSIPEEYGGLGATFAYDAAILEDLETIVPEMVSGVSVSSGIVAHYILKYGTEAQKQRWLPGMARGELIGAIAMTEPGTGSDLQNVRTTARHDGDDYIINGAKTFITNGQSCDLIVVVARTGGQGARACRSSSWKLQVRPDSDGGGISTRSAFTHRIRPNYSSRRSGRRAKIFWGERRGRALSS